MQQTDSVTENEKLKNEVTSFQQNNWDTNQFTVTAALGLVKNLRELGDRRLAQEVLTHALTSYPQNVEFFNEQGYLDLDAKKYDKAVKSFEKTIKKAPAAANQLRIDALIGAGAAQRNLRHFEKAAELFPQAVAASADPPAVALVIEQGWLAFYKKCYEDAFARFQQAADRLSEDKKHEARIGLLASRRQLDLLSAPCNDDGSKQLVSGWRNAGVDPNEIISIFVDCSKSVLEHLNLYPAALRNAEHLLQIDKNNPDGIYCKIGALKWLRRYPEAEKTYREAPHEMQTNIDIWNERANSLYEQKRYHEAYLHYSGKVLDRPNLTAAEKELKERLKSNLEAREWAIVSLRKMRRFDDARREVEAALADFDQGLNFITELGALHYAQKDYDNAIKLFDRGLELDDYDTFALQWRTASLRKKGKLVEAKRAMDEALRKVPYSTRLWDERGWLAFDEKDYEAAIKAFEKASELDPYLINKQLAKVEALLLLHRSDDALEVLKKLEQQFPNDAEVSEQLCWLYIRLGQNELAREQQIRLRQMYPNSALAFNAQGGYELAQRNYVAAEQAFRKTIALVDYEPQYHLNLAWALIRQVRAPGEAGRLETPKREEIIEQAKSHCRIALKLDPFNAKAYGCLGVIAFKQDAFLDAKFYFQKSIDVNPNEGSYVELGSLYCQMGCYDKAGETLQKALDLNPTAHAYIELGNVAVFKEDNKEAIRYCREAVSVDPRNPEAHRALVIALMRAEQYEEAELVVRKALRALATARPWRLHLLLAQILVRLGDIANKDRKKKDLDLYEEALSYVNEARQLSAPHADISFHLGIIQYRLEDLSTSQKSFAECLKLNRDRFDAERNSRIVRAAIDQQRRLFMINKSYSYMLAGVCIVMLTILWFSYFRGYKRTIMVSPATTASSTAKEPVPTDEYIIDRPLLNVMTPILLGLLTIAALLPNLSKLKLPGFEAEITEPKSAEPNISTGPRGEIGFGSSLPIIDPEPR
ncbi:MAG TPA: tetratricopeptide repeat protein [Pyrinomonadaceae bacterium]|nr:tetratricopeptide repeat protein [Pyrinomonadaceae bacterium]